jgi:hypothetical protein
MSTTVRLALFVVALGVAFVVGLGIGSLVGPFDDDAPTAPTHEVTDHG